MRGLALILFLLPLGSGAQAPDFTRLVRAQSAAVVSIGGAYTTPPVLPDFPVVEDLQHLMERAARGVVPNFEAPSLGTGFIVTGDGYIVTAYHIVEEAFNDEVVVRLADGRELVGRVVGMDRASDIGLVKITTSGLPEVKIGDPALLEPGEWVVTIGSPFGFERSVAAGVVSTTSRAIPSETHIRFIQTDVAMNPGHSGGPLFNLKGEVVGVNSMIFSATGGSIGLSFAVPIDVAMKVVESLRARGTLRRGRIGVLLQEVTPELAQAFRLPRATGALITAVERKAPAERAGLRAGDVSRASPARRCRSTSISLRSPPRRRPAPPCPSSTSARAGRSARACASPRRTMIGRGRWTPAAPIAWASGSLRCRRRRRAAWDWRARWWSSEPRARHDAPGSFRETSCSP